LPAQTVQFISPFCHCTVQLVTVCVKKTVNISVADPGRLIPDPKVFYPGSRLKKIPNPDERI
jgi:hypothetical protein